MKFWVTQGGRDAEVEFHVEGDRLWLEIENRRIEADVRRLPDGEVYSLLIGGRSYEVHVAPTGDLLEVSLRGSTVAVEVRHPLERLLQSVQKEAGPSRAQTIVAPMPGMVVSIKVKPGDSVVAGQPVVVVEAMKMQNELAPKHAGVVREILVGERTSVSAGQVLIKLGPVA